MKPPRRSPRRSPDPGARAAPGSGVCPDKTVATRPQGVRPHGGPVRRLLLLTLAVLAGWPACASAAESPMPTRQQVAMNMAWASTLAPEDLPPVDRRAVVCLVDTGVDVTPDLPADRPEGPIVARRVAGALRYAGDTDDGRAGPTEIGGHGTRMASFIAAQPGNDWGTVGLVPWVRVLSLRTVRKGEEVFDAGAYESGLRECQRWKSEWPGLAVVSLSLNCRCSLTPVEEAQLEEAVRSARLGGMTVVASAGNAARASVEPPASVPGVLPAAATGGGGLCPFSSWGPSALLAPGCDVDGEIGGGPQRVDAAGSSASAAMVASAVAALRSLAPDATGADVERALRETASVLDGRRVIDGREAARALGLADVVARAEHTAAPSPPPIVEAPAAPIPAAAPTDHRPSVAVGRLPRPRVRLRALPRKRFEVRVLNRPRGATVEVAAGRSARAARTSRLRMRGRRWTVVKTRFLTDRAVSPRTRSRNPWRRRG